MASKKKVKGGICLYCGGVADSEDHIPPKGLWKGNRPNNLITVPACRQCNQAASGDDEFFRDSLVMMADTSPGTAAAGAMDAMMRAFALPAKQKYKQQMVSRVSEEVVRLPSGLIARLPLFVGDLTRMDAVVKRVVKGLYFQEARARLPDSHAVEVFETRSLYQSGLGAYLKFHKAALALTAKAPVVVGQQDFVYWFQQDAADPATSVCLMVFYRKLTYFAMTLNKNHLTEPGTQRSSLAFSQ